MLLFELLLFNIQIKIMKPKISQDKIYFNFYENIKRELDIAFKNASVEQIHQTKNRISEFFFVEHRSSKEQRKKGLLSKKAEELLDAKKLNAYKTSLLIEDNIRSVLAPYAQGEEETEDLYSARIEIPQKIAGELCLASLRKRQKDIGDIIESSDRIKKITLLLIKQHYPHSNYALGRGDLKNSASINHLLHTKLLRFTYAELKHCETYQPYYSALFEDHRFLYFIEKTKVPHAPYEYLCIYNSLTPLDLFRIETEITHKMHLENRNLVFQNTIAGFAHHEKKLKKIDRSLAKLKNPLYAELKEYIFNAGFSINKNTGAEILLNPAHSADLIIKQIRTIEKRVEQREFRKKDTYTQINFNVYNLPNSYLHRDEFNRNKSALINNLIHNFLAIGTKHINTAIASNKNLPYKKSSTKLTIRVPKKAHLKIKNLAKQHKITQELLVNIIIQDNKDNDTHFIKKTSNQKRTVDTQAPAAHDEKSHSQARQPLQTATSTTEKPQPTAQQVAIDSDNESQSSPSKEKQTPNTLARDKPSLGKFKNQHYTKNSTSTENQKSSKLEQAINKLSSALDNN